jgi:D-lactate dehydrogenase (cytochrome)
VNFYPLKQEHLTKFKSMIAPDCFSSGDSPVNLYAKDQASHAPFRPEAVIWQLSAAEVAEIVAFVNMNRIPATGWSSGSSLEGNPIPVCSGIVMDFSRMNQIMDIRAGDFQTDVEPAVV